MSAYIGMVFAVKDHDCLPGDSPNSTVSYLNVPYDVTGKVPEHTVAKVTCLFGSR